MVQDGVVPIPIEPYNDGSDNNGPWTSTGGTKTTGGTQEVLRYPLEMPDHLQDLNLIILVFEARNINLQVLTHRKGI